MIEFTNIYKWPKEGWGRKMFDFKLIYRGGYKGIEITIFYITTYIGTNEKIKSRGLK